MRVLFVLCTVLLLAATQAFADSISIPMDQQVGNNAIYAPYSDTLTFEPAGGGEPSGFARVHIVGGSWYYGPYVDFHLYQNIDLSITDPLSQLEVDLRYFQGGGNQNPYADAPIFLRLYTIDATGAYLGHREYGIIYATQSGDAPYPDWTHKLVMLNDSAVNPYTDGGVFNPASVGRLRFYGTDWSGVGDDFTDTKNLLISNITTQVVPEPGSLLALGVGLVGVLPFVRRRR